jgi:hypothetical protein
MAANTDGPIWELVPKDEGLQFTSADTTTKKTLVTGGTNGTRVDAIWVSTNDTAAVNLAFYLKDGSTSFYIGVVSVPIGSGYTTVARVDALAVLSPILGYLIVENGWTLECNCVATMTAAKTTDVVAIGGEY